MKIRRSIKSWYVINLIEGEGVGTAYEYYAKTRKLVKFINSIEKPKSILIAGLPEKYGLSLDFFLLGQALQAEIVVIDERHDALERAREALLALQSKKLFDGLKVTFLKTDRIAEFDDGRLIEGKFDIALTSEVLQRLGDAKETYIDSLKRLAKNYVIFAPNRGNKSHANLSGLKSVYLMDLVKYCEKGQAKRAIYEYGFLDMPPFPPGLSRSKVKRMQAAESQVETFLMKGLEIYCLCEFLFPKFLKEKTAHIAYVMVKNE